MNFVTPVRLWLPCVFLLSLCVQVDGESGWMWFNMSRCRNILENGTDPVDPKNITYELCVKRCGGGIGWFNWAMFVQGITSWLLPWVALTSQLPFGATST